MPRWRQRYGPRPPNGDAGATDVCYCCFDAKAGWTITSASTGSTPSSDCRSVAVAAADLLRHVGSGPCLLWTSTNGGRWTSCPISWPMVVAFGCSTCLTISAAAVWPPRSTPPCRGYGSVASSNEHWFTSLADARRILAAWRLDYNTVRPHSSLQNLTPEQFAQQQRQTASLPKKPLLANGP